MNLIIVINNIIIHDEKEQKNIFQPFMRGQNAKGTSGFGLGLRIVQRVLTLHKSKITYSIPTNNTNLFQLIFHV